MLLRYTFLMNYYYHHLKKIFLRKIYCFLIHPKNYYFLIQSFDFFQRKKKHKIRNLHKTTITTTSKKNIYIFTVTVVTDRIKLEDFVVNTSIDMISPIFLSNGNSTVFQYPGADTKHVIP